MNDRIIRKYNAWRLKTIFCDACGAPAIVHLEHCGECGADFFQMHSLIKTKIDEKFKHFTAPFRSIEARARRQPNGGDLQSKHSRSPYQRKIQSEATLQG